MERVVDDKGAFGDAGASLDVAGQSDDVSGDPRSVIGDEAEGLHVVDVGKVVGLPAGQPVHAVEPVGGGRGGEAPEEGHDLTCILRQHGANRDGGPVEQRDVDTFRR